MDLAIYTVLVAIASCLLTVFGAMYVATKKAQNKTAPQQFIRGKTIRELSPGNWGVDRCFLVVTDDQGHSDVIYNDVDIPMTGRFKVEFRIGNEIIPIEEGSLEETFLS